MAAVHVGINLQPGDDFRQAVYPLFAADEIETVEYSFDTGWGPAGEPEWLAESVNHFAAEDRLLGHGVTYSALTGEHHERQDRWLARFAAEVAKRRYRHVSEHFGFSAAGNFHDSAPLPVPRTPGALRVGRDRLARLADAAGVPVGLENLAFAFGTDDVKGQGAFLDELLAPCGGFLLLDLHNIYCQSYNFRVDPAALLDAYPLARVRELHVAGGSWAEPQGERFRRDTHDGPVPEEVFALVPLALARCPNVRAVVFEHMEGTLPEEAQRERLRADYRRLRALVRECVARSNEVPDGA